MQDLFVDFLVSPPLRDAPPPKAYLVSLLKCLYAAAELRQLPLSDRFAAAVFEHVSAYSKCDDLADKPFVSYETLDAARPPQVFTFRTLPCRNELGLRTWTAGFFLVEYLASYGHQFRCLSCLCPSLAGASSRVPQGDLEALASACASLRFPFSSATGAQCCCGAAWSRTRAHGERNAGGEATAGRACPNDTCCQAGEQNSERSWSRRMLEKIEAAQPGVLPEPPVEAGERGKGPDTGDEDFSDNGGVTGRRTPHSRQTLSSSLASSSPPLAPLSSRCRAAFAPLSVLELGSGLGVTASVLCAPARASCFQGESGPDEATAGASGSAFRDSELRVSASLPSSDSLGAFSAVAASPPALGCTTDARLSSCCVYVASDFLPSILSNCAANLRRNAVVGFAQSAREGLDEADAHASDETEAKAQERGARDARISDGKVEAGGGSSETLQRAEGDTQEETGREGKVETNSARQGTARGGTKRARVLCPRVFLELLDFADAKRRAPALLKKICEATGREAARRQLCAGPHSRPCAASSAPPSGSTSGVLLIVGSDLIYDEGLNALLASALSTLLRCPLEEDEKKEGQSAEGEKRGHSEESEKRGEGARGEWRRICVLCSAIREEATREHFLKELDKHGLVHVEDRRPVARVLPYERRRVVVDIIVPREAL
ncbi:conserved hypothetical protein [Neospora caninum Liverpool]|nr:conserved hypothetical protein [Neospora caninum Liverpool]CBZ50440.1 conserved hypothetical protein [Neospora caninum Liverpool]|eukprot:XP_003880473.1 conserved hypothetical protein [Neospora caninum Liverpool]